MKKGLMQTMAEIEERRLDQYWERKREEAYFGTAAWCREHGGVDVTCIGDNHHRFIMPSGSVRMATDRIRFELPGDRAAIDVAKEE